MTVQVRTARLEYSRRPEGPRRLSATCRSPPSGRSALLHSCSLSMVPADRQRSEPCPPADDQGLGQLAEGADPITDRGRRLVAVAPRSHVRRSRSQPWTRAGGLCRGGGSGRHPQGCLRGRGIRVSASSIALISPATEPLRATRHHCVRRCAPSLVAVGNPWFFQDLCEGLETQNPQPQEEPS